MKGEQLMLPFLFDNNTYYQIGKPRRKSILQQIEFDIKLSEQDMKDFASMHFLKSSIWVGIFYIAASVIAFVYELLSVLDGRGTAFSYFIMVVFPLSYLLTYVLIINKTRKNFRSNKLASRKFTYIIDEQGISHSSDINKSTINWTNINRFIESKKTLALYISKNQAFILPKEQVGQGNLMILKEIIQNKVHTK